LLDLRPAALFDSRDAELCAAVRLLERAVEMGREEALGDLGDAYREDHSGDSMGLAIECYRKAAAKGDKDAAESLAEVLADIEGEYRASLPEPPAKPPPSGNTERRAAAPTLAAS